MTPEEFARRIYEGLDVELPSEMGKDIEWARRACNVLSKFMERKWGKVVGLKAGLTSEESKRLFEGGPIYGPLHERNVLENANTVVISRDEFVDPMAEVEVAVVDDKTYIAIEIPNNRYKRKWNELKAVDIQADLGGEGKLVLLAPFTSSASVRVKDKETEVNDMAGKGWVYGWLKSIRDDLKIYLLGTIIRPIRLNDELEVSCCGKSITLTVI